MGVRITEDPVVNERGYEEHPAFGQIEVARVSSTPGISLFDSDVRHQHYVTVKIRHADRTRTGGRDWIHGTRDIVEVSLSEAQWAQAITNMNTTGTPVTITWTREDGMTPAIPFRPRSALSRKEVRDAADKVFEKAREALALVEERPTKANIRNLRTIMDNAARNVEYAAKVLDEHVEGTVTRARFDVEAMVSRAASQGVTGVPVPVFEIGTGDE